MVHFVGAGSGAVDLITVRGAKLLSECDVVIYAGSLVNPDLLSYCKKDCKIYNSATMTLEQVIDVIVEAEAAEKPPSGSTPAIPVFTEPSGSSSTNWSSGALPTTSAPASAPSAVPPPP